VLTDRRLPVAEHEAEVTLAAGAFRILDVEIDWPEYQRTVSSGSSPQRAARK
jgi:hypothetical protein